MSLSKSVAAIVFATSLLCASARADGFDPRLLPPTASYARNATCAPVAIDMPYARHFASDGDLVCPKPDDMPLGQGDTATCFAYSTADMISQRVGMVVSPIDVATKFWFADPARLKAIADPALQAHLKRAGDVADATLDARIAAVDITRDKNPARLPFVDKLEGGEEDIAALLYNIGGLCADADLPSFDGYKFSEPAFAKLRTQTRLSSLAPQSFRSLASTAPALRARETDAFNAAWLAHVETVCKRRASPVPLLPVVYRIAAHQRDFMRMIEEGRPPSRAQTARMFAAIDYALDHGRAPAIGYSYWLLEAREPNDPDLEADHSSVVIGRRKIGGACQYRIQDNTGQYCSRMRPELAARCENGRIWATEEELRRSLYSVTYLR